MIIVPELARAFEPWKNAFGDSAAISTAVTAAHVMSLFLGGGLAVAADRTSLRMFGREPGERTAHLRELQAVHRPVLIALAVLFLSGLLLAAADVETFAVSWIFWVKMGLVALLLVNGAVLTRTESRLRTPASGAPSVPDAAPAPAAGDAALWNRLRLASIASLALWTLTALAGEALAGLS